MFNKRWLFAIIVLFSTILKAEEVPDGERCVILYTATWCGPCRALKNAIKEQKIKDFLKSGYRHFYTIDIDDPKTRLWVDNAKVKSVPTIVVYEYKNQKIKSIAREIGYSSSSGLLEFLSKWRKKDGKDQLGSTDSESRVEFSVIR